MRGRERVGIPKYGVTVDRTDLTSAQWATHLSEELMDALLYLRRMQTIKDNCTCPSGDGSLRWPCPKHPPQFSDANQKAGVDEVARYAARYRWLRSANADDDVPYVAIQKTNGWGKTSSCWLQEDEADQAIDAAIQSAARDER